MNRTSIVMLLLLISSLVLAGNPKVEKLRETMLKRLEEIKVHPIISSQHRYYLDKYEGIQQIWIDLNRSDNPSEADDRFISDAINLLIEFYEASSPKGMLE